MDDQQRLAASFDQAAELYATARPGYPPALFDRLLEVTGLRAGDRVLEVGSGPGTATLPLVERGLRLTALEPGAALAARARARLAGFDAEVVQTGFEDWAGPSEAYAAVVSATAWHWVDPDRRYALAAAALRPGGWLAVWSAQHVFPPDGDPFFAEIQEVYDSLSRTPPGPTVQPAPGELPELTAEVEESGLFETVSVDHLDWTLDYTAEAYLNLLRTFSGHILMSTTDRDRLFSEIRRRIALRPSGTVRRGWGAVLHIARKR